MISGLYVYVSVGIASAALSATGAWQVQNWRYGEQLSEKDAAHAELVASSAKSALRLTEIYRDNANEALRKSEARTIQNKRDADILRDQLDGLRGDLATVPNRISSATRAAVDEYAATAGVVFDQCSRRYSEMAAAAQGHAADAEALRDAWPK